MAVQYTCPPESVGTRLRVESGGASVEGRLLRAYNPEPRMRPTRDPKKRSIQTFATQHLGEIQLDARRQRITLRALNKPGDCICDIKCVSLEAVCK